MSLQQIQRQVSYLTYAIQNLIDAFRRNATPHFIHLPTYKEKVTLEPIIFVCF
jgi:hypothetical protein